MRGAFAVPRAAHLRGVRGRPALAPRTLSRRGAGPGGGPLYGQPRARRGDHRLRRVSGPPDLVAFAFHWLEYLGLLGGLGSFVIKWLGSLTPRIRWTQPPLHNAYQPAVVGNVSLSQVVAVNQ